MNPSIRPVLSTLALLLVAALLGVAGGYVYAHDPQRDVLTISLDTTASTDTAAPIGGTVIEVSGGRLRLNSTTGPIDLALPASARIEELRALPGTALAPGSVVNVGAERSDSSMAISGIVALEAAR